MTLTDELQIPVRLTVANDDDPSAAHTVQRSRLGKSGNWKLGSRNLEVRKRMRVSAAYRIN
jgi:hypothetical protein